MTAGTARKILVVDDEFSILETLAEVLSFEGYQVITATDGARALSLIEQEAPSLVLLDYMMPVMDGLELLRKLRTLPWGARLPVILMTAAPLSVPEDERRWNILLRKPFDIQGLLDAIERLQNGVHKPGPGAGGG